MQIINHLFRFDVVLKLCLLYLLHIIYNFIYSFCPFFVHKRFSASSGSAWGRGAPISSNSGSAWSRGAPSSASSGGGERPRLNLSKKTEQPSKENSGSNKDVEEKKEDSPVKATPPPAVKSFAAMAAKPAAVKEDKKVEPPTAEVKAKESTEGGEKKEKKEEENKSKDESPGKDGEKRRGRDRRERKYEPKVVNSRAAMLGEAAAPKKEVREISGFVWNALYVLAYIQFPDISFKLSLYMETGTSSQG